MKTSRISLALTLGSGLLAVGCSKAPQEANIRDVRPTTLERGDKFLVEALAHDAHRLSPLLHAHGEAVPGIADRAHLPCADWHVELDLPVE